LVLPDLSPVVASPVAKYALQNLELLEVALMVLNPILPEEEVLFEVDPSSVEVDPPSVEVDPSSVEVDSSSVEADPSSVEVDPSSVEVVHPLYVRAVHPLFLWVVLQSSLVLQSSFDLSLSWDMALLDYSYIVLEPCDPSEVAEVDIPAEVAFDLSFEEGTFAGLLEDTGSCEVLVGDFS